MVIPGHNLGKSQVNVNRTIGPTLVYHMTLLLFSGKRHVINNFMTTHVLTLSAGTSNVMTTSVTTMHLSLKYGQL